jgi:hypothetical protein
MLLGLLIRLLIGPFKKLFPLRYSAAQMSVPISELSKYGKYNLLSLLLCILLTPLCIYICFAALHAVISDSVPAIAKPVVAIRAGDGFWFATALLPGIVLACCLIALIVRLILGAEKSAEYRMLSNRRGGFDATRFFIVLGALVMAGSAVMAYFGMRTGLFLGRDELVFDRIWSLEEERYRYDQVKALREVLNDDGEKWNFVIQIAGAPDWSTGREVTFPDDEQKALLVKRTGKRIVKEQP